MEDVEGNVTTSEKAIVKERLSAEPKENGFHQVDEDDSGKHQEQPTTTTTTPTKQEDITTTTTTTTTSHLNKLGI